MLHISSYLFVRNIEMIIGGGDYGPNIAHCARVTYSLMLLFLVWRAGRNCLPLALSTAPWRAAVILTSHCLPQPPPAPPDGHTGPSVQIMIPSIKKGQSKKIWSLCLECGVLTQQNIEYEERIVCSLLTPFSVQPGRGGRQVRQCCGGPHHSAARLRL